MVGKVDTKKYCFFFSLLVLFVFWLILFLFPSIKMVSFNCLIQSCPFSGLSLPIFVPSYCLAMASFKLSCQTYRNDGSSRQYRDSLSQQQTRISLTCRTGEKKKLRSAHIPCLQEGILVLGGGWGEFWTFHSRRNMADFHTQAHSSIHHKHTPEPTLSVCVFFGGLGWRNFADMFSDVSGEKHKEIRWFFAQRGNCSCLGRGGWGGPEQILRNIFLMVPDIK